MPAQLWCMGSWQPWHQSARSVAGCTGWYWCKEACPRWYRSARSVASSAGPNWCMGSWLPRGDRGPSRRGAARGEASKPGFDADARGYTLIHADGTWTRAAARLIRMGRAIGAARGHAGRRPISEHPRACACICVMPLLACFAARRTVPPRSGRAWHDTASWHCRLTMRGVLPSQQRPARCPAVPANWCMDLSPFRSSGKAPSPGFPPCRRCWHALSRTRRRCRARCAGTARRVSRTWWSEAGGGCRGAWARRAKSCRAGTKEAFNTEAEREPRRTTERECLPISRGRFALSVALRGSRSASVLKALLSSVPERAPPG